MTPETGPAVPPKPHLCGLLLIDKESNWTSFDVVARARTLLHVKKIGHLGTLDPLATGLLVLAVGKATTSVSQFLKLDKTYEATIRLDGETETWDQEGNLVPFVPPPDFVPPTEAHLSAILAERFTGTIELSLPVYSAIMVAGCRAHRLARAGKLQDLGTRPALIHRLELIRYTWPELSIRCHVASGVYVRAIAHDLGKALGTGGYLTALRRTTVGEWRVENSVKINDLKRPFEPRLIAVEGLGKG